MGNKLVVTNIQRMCFHDGPGIRTTVFLKGCNLRCPWCSNPENLNFQIEEYEKDGQKGAYGKLYDTEELFREVIKDHIFWRNEGGVTFSGGEPLMQLKGLRSILNKLKNEGIHIAVETALFVPTTYLESLINVIDYFIVDVKLLDEKQCRNILGGDISIYFKNVERLYASGKLKQFRIPCCKEFVFTENNQELILTFLKQYHDVPVQIFKIHTLGESKYKSLNRTMWQGETIKDIELENFKTKLTENYIQAEIIQI